MSFTSRKFLGLSPAQRQKKCAELLRRVYEGEESLWEDYVQLCHWLDCDPPEKHHEDLANRYHEHLAAAGLSLKEHRLLPRIRTQDDAQREVQRLPIHVYLDQLRSAHNVGSIFRSVEAFGLGTIYLSERCPGPDHKQVRDAAMGADEWVSWQRISDLSELPRPWLVLETAEGAHALPSFVFPEECTLILGNEEYGVSRELVSQADQLIEIPLFGRKNSLNVANAAAVVFAQVSTLLHKF